MLTHEYDCQCVNGWLKNQQELFDDTLGKCMIRYQKNTKLRNNKTKYDKQSNTTMNSENLVCR